MTDHSDLIAELERKAAQAPTTFHWQHALLIRAASALSSQSLSLSEAREDRDSWRRVAERCESEKQAAQATIKRMDRAASEANALYLKMSAERDVAKEEIERSELGRHRLGHALREATRQRDEALAALKASEERGQTLSQELASARLRPEPSSVETGGYWDRPIVDRLRERASVARSEGTGTATADAVHFDQAADEIERLRAALMPFAEAADVWENNIDDASLWVRPLHLVELIKANLTVGALRRAKSALENSKAPLADATNNPPSDPGTEQREAGV